MSEPLICLIILITLISAVKISKQGGHEMPTLLNTQTNQSSDN